MSKISIENIPEVQHLVTEDDEPLDNMLSEKQQRLLTGPLYSSWDGPGKGRRFLAAANVGLFSDPGRRPLVPDMFLSLDVEPARDWMRKDHRSYFYWEFGKPPELALEIVSNREGGEDDEKRTGYARMLIRYYVIYDPLLQVRPDLLTIYRLTGPQYQRQEKPEFPDLGLGLTFWDGSYEGRTDTWLRWVDHRGVLIATGEEQRQRAEEKDLLLGEARRRADEERGRAEEKSLLLEEERQRAEEKSLLLEEERQRAERFAEALRRSGIDPDSL